jgi:hypothetical protein
MHLGCLTFVLGERSGVDFCIGFPFPLLNSSPLKAALCPLKAALLGDEAGQKDAKAQAVLSCTVYCSLPLSLSLLPPSSFLLHPSSFLFPPLSFSFSFS